MRQFFIGSVVIEFYDESGRYKPKRFSALIDAESYTEAEARIYKEMEGEKSPWVISKIAKKKVNDFFGLENLDDESAFFYVKVEYVVFNEKTGAENKTPYFFVAVEDTYATLEDAYTSADNALKGSLDYEIVKIEKMGIDAILMQGIEDEETEESQL